jgi:hypothetical protein
MKEKQKQTSVRNRKVFIEMCRIRKNHLPVTLLLGNDQKTTLRYPNRDPDKGEI